METKIIKKKGSYVLTMVMGETVAISSDDFYSQLMSDKLEFRPEDVYMINIIPTGNGEAAMAAIPLSNHPMGYHTVHLTKSGLQWYDLNDDSPVVKAVVGVRSGLVMPS